MSARQIRSVAVLTAAWGLLATLTSPLTGIVVAGILLLGTPLLLWPGLAALKLQENIESFAKDK